MALDSTVIDDDGNTYVALPCSHCDGDGVTFATLSELRAGLAAVMARRLDDPDLGGARLVDALAGMGTT
jgi:hypothetical protein